MRARLVAVTLLLATIALPVAAHAGQCQAAVLFFEGTKTFLDVINLESTPRMVSFAFFKNNGAFVGDSQMAIAGHARLHVTGPAVYATLVNAPPITDSYVRIRLSPGGAFAASVTSGEDTREVGCVTP